MLEAYSSQVKLVPCDTGKNKSIIGAIFAYVSEHFRESITLTDLEDVCGYSAHYLSRVFSEAVGINFRRFVNELRLEYAVDHHRPACDGNCVQERVRLNPQLQSGVRR